MGVRAGMRVAEPTFPDIVPRWRRGDGLPIVGGLLSVLDSGAHVLVGFSDPRHFCVHSRAGGHKGRP